MLTICCSESAGDLLMQDLDVEDEPPIPLIPAPIPQVLRARKEDDVRSHSAH